jgi:F420-dependent oxidoreductase-like protein
VDYRIFIEPQQGATYSQLARFAKAVEETGFDALFRSDHYLKMGPHTGKPGPTDAWTTLAGLARDTSRIRLGTLVTSATFRLPGPLAITVAQVDEMSGGRVELGLGAGWYTNEHTAYGIPFPSLRERFERLEEQLTIISGLWTTPEDSTFNFTGAHYQLCDSPALPKPVQRPRPPIIVGGGGPTRTPRLAASFADEYNTPFLSADDAANAFARVDAACETQGRDPSTLRKSSAIAVACATSESQYEQRAAAAGWKGEDLRKFGAGGSPSEVAERLALWRDAGATRLYLQLIDVTDLSHLEDVVTAVELLDRA